MKIIKSARSGTLESSDIYIIISPNKENKIEIDLKSTVYNEFSEEIIRTVKETLKKLGVERAYIKTNDRGALDCTIRARVETAALRGSENYG